MPICPGHVSIVVIYCHSSDFLRRQAKSRRVIWTLWPCAKWFKQLTGNQQQAQSLPPAPRGLQFMKKKLPETKVPGNFL
jgi:hypothetical protein